MLAGTYVPIGKSANGSIVSSQLTAASLAALDLPTKGAPGDKPSGIAMEKSHWLGVSLAIPAQCSS